MVGDSLSDIVAARAAEIGKTILFNSSDDIIESDVKSEWVVNSLDDAMRVLFAVDSP